MEQVKRRQLAGKCSKTMILPNGMEYGCFGQIVLRQIIWHVWYLWALRLKKCIELLSKYSVPI